MAEKGIRFPMPTIGSEQQIIELESFNALLARKVAILEKCAEHYADKEDWTCGDDCQSEDPNHKSCLKGCFALDEDGYTIAQQALAEAARIDEGETK